MIIMKTLPDVPDGFICLDTETLGQLDCIVCNSDIVPQVKNFLSRYGKNNFDTDSISVYNDPFLKEPLLVASDECIHSLKPGMVVYVHKMKRHKSTVSVLKDISEISNIGYIHI